MCPFKAGDIVVSVQGKVYWFINDEQYIFIGHYNHSEPLGSPKGLYSDAKKQDWFQCTKVCTIEELRKAIVQAKL